MSIIWKDGKSYDTLWDMYVEDFGDYMREPTSEERQSIEEGIKKISKPIGINFWDYLDKALEEDDELHKEYEALEEEYEIIEEKIKDNRAFVLDPEKADEFSSQSKHDGKKAMDRFFSHKPKEGVMTPYKFYKKIINGSRLTIGEQRKTTLTTDQHFNWFQKLMWKWCFGVKVEDYSEE